MLFTLVLIFLGLAVLQRFVSDTAITTIPWWVTAVIVAAVISGYMWIRTSLEEKRAEAEWIEQEGSVYIRRMEHERQQRSEGEQ
ncbi:Sporulation protein YhaL [Natribacillus halophilus]|uniref:Sporulation protein YhaL n=2 Tax=Natribacillus halophilus TaxID=549003 RepID=A0A1G8NW36_9BACI|nr:Sporulation protein YhaL [Natribacillus halophilus]